jgi:hypothetical protein
VRPRFDARVLAATAAQSRRQLGLFAADSAALEGLRAILTSRIIFDVAGAEAERLFVGKPEVVVHSDFLDAEACARELTGSKQGADALIHDALACASDLLIASKDELLRLASELHEHGVLFEPR